MHKDRDRTGTTDQRSETDLRLIGTQRDQCGVVESQPRQRIKNEVDFDYNVVIGNRSKNSPDKAQQRE